MQYRTHHCNELSIISRGNTATLSGWVHGKRDHGGIIFIDLRDHYGITQLVFNVNTPQYQKIETLKLESVITTIGIVRSRSQETINHDITTGEIELEVQEWSVVSESKMLPFQISVDDKAPEELRLKYRFLDLRRKKMQEMLKMRSDMIFEIRKIMHEMDFLEVQTPIMTSSSPEGARDFLIPSRLNPGEFYALPQAPQQFKQILMASCVDKYFQIAPCFRDEDPRADRSPGEFYQLDIEMSFATQEEIFALSEKVLSHIFKKFSTKDITNTPFPRITYHDAILKYGTDKPDLRNPIQLCDVTDIFDGSDFKLFSNAKKKKQTIRAVPAPGTGGNSRSFFDKKISYAQENLNARGLGYIEFDNEAKGPIAKFLDEDRIQKIMEICNLKDGDSVFFSCDTHHNSAKIASGMRDLIGNELNLIKDEFKFCWIIDFPMYEMNEDTRKIDFSHNPFSMPQGGLNALTTQDPLSILAYQYDIVCNGIELSSGAIRNHDLETMYVAFAISGYSKEEVDAKFGPLSSAFQYGIPPHGGIAPGIDRILMILQNAPNLRDIIAFPMNQRGRDLLMNAPSQIKLQSLKELNILCQAA